MDIFAQIAANGIGGREELLHEPQPIKFEKKAVVLDRAIIQRDCGCSLS